MITRIANRVRHLIHPVANLWPTAVERTTYFEEQNQWYLPAIVGPSTLVPQVVGAEVVADVVDVLQQLTPDKYSRFVLNFYEAGLERFGSDWVYADINTVLLGLSRALGVESYLEIGIRRGRSMAMVASQSQNCRIAGFDKWIENYAGMDNPGEQLVRAELGRVGYTGEFICTEGDSQVTVPDYFEQHPDDYFDMITVDGDHTLKGARIDLENVMDRVKVGGALVFDDISNQDHLELAGLWDQLVAGNPRFAAYSFTEVGFGIGFAIRKY